MAPDDVEDWPEFDSEPTRLDSGGIPVAAVFDAATPTHMGAEFLAGREAGWSDGVGAALAALREALAHVGVTGDVATAIVNRVRIGADSRG